MTEKLIYFVSSPKAEGDAEFDGLIKFVKCHIDESVRCKKKKIDIM